MSVQLPLEWLGDLLRAFGDDYASDSEAAGRSSRRSSSTKRFEERDFFEAVRDRLGEDRRRLFDLAVQGLAWTEISAIVGGKPDALRMRLRRGIASVLTELGEEERIHV
jgi:DNA-directed RNA polymerase specialized sigma24 family protein